MKQEIREKLALFAENAQAVRKEFIWHDTLIKKLAALLHSLENKPVNCTAIRLSHALIKNNTGAFSAFRGNMALCVAAMLSLKDNSSELFADTAAVYEMLKSAKFWPSDYLVIAAYEIALQAEPQEYQQVISRTREFYDGMKSKGFLRTGQDDYIFSAMLGLSDIDVKTGTESIEKLYQRFKPEFWSGNSVQSLAQVLVLSGECETAVNRILKLRDAMKAQKIRLDSAYTLPSLGVLALLPAGIDTLVRDINEALAYLRKQKGFSFWSVSKQALLLFASAIVASVYADDIKNGATASLSTSIASIVIAQQTAVIAAAAASASAAAASN
jgi:hypothetical protein